MVCTVNWVYNQTMGRPSNRAQRRAELTLAFARVLADHGYAGATIEAVAEAAGVSPGLVHHHFADKHDLLDSLLQDLIARFRQRIRLVEADTDPLDAYALAAVRLDDSADIVAARCWVGVLAEAVRSPPLFARVRRLVDAEVGRIRQRSGGAFSAQEAGAVLAFVIGSLVVGAFAPRATAGFAAPALHLLIEETRRRHASG